MKKSAAAFFIFISSFAFAQSNLRQRQIVVAGDSMVLDTLSIIPKSYSISFNGVPVSDSCFTFLSAKAVLIFKNNCGEIKTGDTVLVSYRVFPLFFEKEYSRRSIGNIQKNFAGQYNPFSYKEGDGRQPDIFQLQGLQRSGSISRGISFGNNQDVVVNSSLNLQLAGKLGDNVEILAAITDNNIPLQPEGNTQQLQDFDKVFIQLSQNKSKLVAGDFELTRPESYFMNFYKKGQGAKFNTEFDLNNPQKKNKKWIMRTGASGAISKGKFARNTVQGIESNQGPYRLTGAENEQFIIVLSGSEKVFIDGQLMTRGQQNDYVIDYNTAQITFTSHRLITKDSRIVVEFQYSDKNYVRTFLYANNEVENDKVKIKLNLFSEQDSKNQPLFQDLDTDKKIILASVGDSIFEAFVPGVDTVPFSASEVLYKRDTATISGVLYTFYAYSIDSTIILYRLSFSLVGANKGNYTTTQSSANGKVFSFVAPVNGIPQGNYEPVVLLVTPKKQQLLTLGAEYLVGKNSKINSEIALSNNDINLFADFDKRNDKGIAIAAGFQNAFGISKKDSLLKFTTALNIEHVDKNFKPVETYRPIEFTRDWNLSGLTILENEDIASARIGLYKSQQKNAAYVFKTFLKGAGYNGYLNNFSGNYGFKKFNLFYNGSYLLTSGNLSKTRYLRSAGDFSKTIKKITVGYKQQNERNRIFKVQTDTLQLNSFAYDMGGVYLQSADTTKIKFRTEVSRRYDFGLLNNDFSLSTTGDNASGDVEWSPNPNANISLGSTFRTLKINREEITAQKKDKSLLNRAELNFVLFKGVITTNTYYELGSGQEPKQAYSFIKVNKGAGVFEWIDYNSNGIEELNEFEIASFTDHAEYIKVFTPTNEYIKTQSNQLSQVLGLNPSAYFGQKKSKGAKFISHFANQLSARFDNKIQSDDIEKALNPFVTNITDTALITTNSSVRNTFYFNRSSSVFGGEITGQDVRNKSYLANGFESRNTQSIETLMRLNIKRIYGLSVSAEQGKKVNGSPFLNRNYDIHFLSLKPKLSIQPGVVFRTTFNYQLQMKENVFGDTDEKTEIHSIGSEIKYSSVKRGNAEAKLTFIRINYNADENTPLAFEMLEGLKKGNNITWQLSIQRNLSNSLQLSLNYEGRKSEAAKTIHTANMQVRAIF